MRERAKAEVPGLAEYILTKFLARNIGWTACRGAQGAE